MSFTRRELLLSAGAAALPQVTPDAPKRVAAVVTHYIHNSHADVIVSRMFETEALDGKGRKPQIHLVGLYVDQFPAADVSRRMSKEHGFKVYPTIHEALTLGGDSLAVDGVLIIGEHGDYPHDAYSREMYPRKRFFDESVAVMRQSGRSVPVFMDKHLSHRWEEAKEMIETARALHIPMMAGSSVPGTWRRPAADVTAGAKLKEIVGVSYHTLYGYGFHALEMAQCLAEQRRGGESGIKSVRCLEGEAVWNAGSRGLFDLKLMEEALSRLSRPLPADWRKSVPKPVLFHIRYRDGLKSSILTLNTAVNEWAAAWREEGLAQPKSTLFWTQEERPLGHFGFLFRGIEQMMLTGRPTWPVERTVLTTGSMDALLTSLERGGSEIRTPHLDIRYRPTWQWKDPGPPPPGRPLDQQ
jgi:hypothetical protein